MSEKLVMSKNEIEKFDESIIRDRIYSIRGFQVMLDSDLAELYEVEVKYLNRAVKRNITRFPSEFCFLLNKQEMSNLKCQFGTSSWGGKRKNSLAFTEQGVAMLAGVLKSEIAVKISIQIIKTFVEMRKFLQSNAQVFQRLDRVELKQIESDSRIDQVFSLMESGEAKFKQGVFFENQIFDAYHVVSEIFRTAKKSILIIDNYVDDSVLKHLVKRLKGVEVMIYTKKISEQLALDVEKFNKQYESIKVKVFTHAHDRFIIIDNMDVYHLGASLKDLGKKWFAFSKIDKADMELLSKLEKY
ncbi:MAG: ORF6N domain-containing protein [Candidatus Delongbacteria bacterium]|nr:ORF6N domain-containing protein [Candidatus Delongbacteria bacterium]